MTTILKIFAGITAAQLSRKAGVPNATISDWLTGRKPRNFDQVKKVAGVFGITLDHLLYGEGEEEKEFVTDIGQLFDDENWVGGVFEVKIRRIKKRK